MPLPAPSHRNPDDPQIEVCDLCGLHVGGAHLRTATAEGLEGVRVCDVTPGCRAFRVERHRHGTSPPTGGIGQGRVYDPGSPDWAE